MHDIAEHDDERRRDHATREFLASRDFDDRVRSIIVETISEPLERVHDYRSMVQQVIQNLSSILEERIPSKPIDEQLAGATHHELAIYRAAELMLDKIDSALFVKNPELVTASNQAERIRIHGLVTKYVRIYDAQASAKNLRVSIPSGNWDVFQANPRAVGSIIHALLDNAIKYAPQGSSVAFDFASDQANITLSVRSKGPTITADEMTTILGIGGRGRAAQEAGIDGTGFGLGSAQNIAKAMGTSVVVQQERSTGANHMTTFSIAFPKQPPHP